MAETTVQPLRIRTDEFDRMTDVGLFDGRRVELVEGTLYEMPPMGGYPAPARSGAAPAHADRL